MWFSFREEAHVLRAGASHTSSRAWVTSYPAVTPAIPATAASLKLSATAAAWIIPANTAVPSTDRVVHVQMVYGIP